MAEAVPKIRVTDPQSRETNGFEKQDRQSKGDETLPASELTAKVRTSPLAPTTETAHNGNTEGMRPSEAGIDPISQQIFQRTSYTQPNVLKLRTQTENSLNQSPPSPAEPFPDTKPLAEPIRENSGGFGNKSDKKKGVSFLSRIIGNKKRSTVDGDVEDGSEAGDPRPEGMDAQIFSQTVDNMGFSPKHPQPPAYIKVRSKFKREREFNRVFLAQELRAGAEKKSPANGASPVPSGSAGTQNPVWAMEFSKDGKYLAAGGQDKIVRVWAVISTAEERRAHEKEESGPDGSGANLSAPVFQQRTFREYVGHTATILDLSWSKNNFLLSSSMDKTVRLWHISRSECLCTFKHTDFVPSIQFHPKDDRFFLAGSLDCKLRLWSIPDKSVAFWNQLPDMITAVSFTPDGKTCIAGTLSGLCLFYETEGLKYQTQIHVKSTRGQNAKGSKITGIQATHFPPGSTGGEVKLLISSNDSRVRLYHFRDKSLELKFKGHENNSSQIRASFADDTKHVVCGSEDRKVYIWSVSGPAEGDRRNQRPVEMFDAHNSITTCAILAPLKTRQMLSNSEDPIYDLCNPPPVTLISREESANSSRAPTEAGSRLPTPAGADSTFRRVAESPAYIARSAHTDGNIIVTADYTGAIKVFRQDCAFQKRIRAMDAWETSSVFSRKVGSKTSRPSSIMTHRSGRRRDSTSTQPPSDRILSWRQDISHGSFDSVNGLSRGKSGRSMSPRKPSTAQMSVPSSTRRSNSPLRPLPKSHTAPLAAHTTTSIPSISVDRPRPASMSSKSSTPPRAATLDPLTLATTPPKTADGSTPNPLAVYNGQSWAFWNKNAWREQSGSQRREDPKLVARKSMSTVSRLSSEPEDSDDEAVAGKAVEAGGKKTTAAVAEDEERCRECKGVKFKVKVVRGVGGPGGGEERRLVCSWCGTLA
jgi:WD40 repeat protein